MLFRSEPPRPHAGARPPAADPPERCGALGQRRAAAAAHASARPRRRLGGGAAVRTAPLPTAVPMPGVRRLTFSPRGWLHVGTGGVGERLPPRSRRWPAPGTGGRFRLRMAEGQWYWAPPLVVAL